ncbi:MAG: Re/Si-specific NAD(P)(+) transhydrogenase subunit alpha [Gemmatimonadetes bacterium]|nr:Re/Si-specific NAD(P)(+) transhydrogenase subunit alpha [Gemmatimonadota bacterium]
MTIAIMAESGTGERRVALVPDAVRYYRKRGWDLRVQAGAGLAASFPDGEFQDAGVALAPDRDTLLDGARVVLKVLPPSLEEVAALPRGSVLVCHLDPLGPTETIEALADHGVTSFAVELIPRITRAQKMDVLSSQATVAGYKAVLNGAGAMTRFLPMLTTAAGTVRPAKAMILGAGVAGLQAIATARRLGAVVSAFDIRPAVKEQVQSLGAKFLEAALDEGSEDEGGYAKALSEEQHQRELELIAANIRDQDLIVTTAQIPGRPAPVLITREMVASMRPGSVIVDLASESGGNCELTVAGQSVEQGGVTIMGPSNLPAELPFHASQMYARNVASLVDHLFDDEGEIDYEDEITAATCVTHDGMITNDRVRDNLAPTME